MPAHGSSTPSLPLPLATERLILRDVRPDDWRDVHAYASDPEVVKHMIWGPNTEEQSRANTLARSQTSQDAERRAWELVVELKSAGRVIGGCGLRIHSSTDRDADVGYVLSRSYWGQGLITEAGCALLHAGFSILGLHRIWATTDPENVRSRRVLERLGMRYEGCLREHRFCKQRWRDSAVYAVLEHEWRNP